MAKQRQTIRDYMRRLYNSGRLEEKHVIAAAKYVSLVYSGYGSKSVNLDRVDGTKLPQHPHLASIPLSKLPRYNSRVLYLALIEERSLIHIGGLLGETSNTTSYRRGFKELVDSLEIAYNVLC